MGGPLAIHIFASGTLPRADAGRMAVISAVRHKRRAVLCLLPRGSDRVVIGSWDPLSVSDGGYDEVVPVLCLVWVTRT